MVKFTVTSPSFSGEIYVVYGQNNELLLLDFLHAEIGVDQIQWIKDRMPAMYFKNNFLSHFGKANLNFISSDFDVTFQQFWDFYNKKINKGRCLPKWNKLSHSERVKAYFGVKVYFNYLKGTGFRSKADPERYLNDKMWENEWK